MKKTLNNVQMFYNSVRMPAIEDPLCQLANKYEYEDNSCDCEEQDDEDEDDEFLFDGFLSSPNNKKSATAMTLSKICH